MISDITKLWISVIVAIIGAVWIISELLFASFMPLGKAHAAHIQLAVNQTRGEYERLLANSSRTPKEEARLEVLQKQISQLREDRDRLLGLR
jgi:hypothetical protein